MLSSLPYNVMWLPAVHVMWLPAVILCYCHTTSHGCQPTYCATAIPRHIAASRHTVLLPLLPTTCTQERSCQKVYVARVVGCFPSPPPPPSPSSTPQADPPSCGETTATPAEGVSAASRLGWLRVDVPLTWDAKTNHATPVLTGVLRLSPLLLLLLLGSCKEACPVVGRPKSEP